MGRLIQFCEGWCSVGLIDAPAIALSAEVGPVEAGG